MCVCVQKAVSECINCVVRIIDLEMAIRLGIKIAIINYARLTLDIRIVVIECF